MTHASCIHQGIELRPARDGQNFYVWIEYKDRLPEATPPFADLENAFAFAVNRLNSAAENSD